MKKFRIEFKVDALHLGDVLATIHGRAEDLDVSLIEDVPHDKNVRRKKKQPASTMNARELIMDALEHSPDNTLTVEQGKQILTQAGLDGARMYGIRYTLAKKGIIHYRNQKLTLVK